MPWDVLDQSLTQTPETFREHDDQRNWLVDKPKELKGYGWLLPDHIGDVWM
ncbi:hypothetical protein [Vibrio renipiscarius]|uniref:hypothetical protein n=1 Tax=Vibrio renipiscarius TaxID=1461322 RepID=UPI000AEEC310|nr:hypothetical protein [Vibrio renipiscarius]